MLVSLGKKAPSEPTLTDRLLDCHARIRKFCAIARRLAASTDPAAAREAAAALHRYFTVALPLHVADEEQSVRPRLVRLGEPALTAALDAMAAEHEEAAATLAELTRRWRQIAEAPTPARSAATDAPAAWLAEHFERHLDAEETRIFPALAKLPPAEAAAVVAELGARRA